MVTLRTAGGLDLTNELRRHRERLGLSQQALAERVGVSRQAIHAIEAGRQVPSTSLALQLAHAVGRTVEDIFAITPAGPLQARLAASGGRSTRSALPGQVAPDRVALGLVDGAWIAHPLSHGAVGAADGIAKGVDTDRSAGGAAATASVLPLAAPAVLERNVLVAGCAPLLGTLAARAGTRFTDARITWLPATSRAALDLLREGLVHVAGLHLVDARSRPENVGTVRRAFPGRRMLVVNLTRWRQGLIVAEGNPLGIRSAADLLRPRLRFAQREQGAGAHGLVSRLLLAEGAERVALAGPLAAGHAEVAQLVRCGAADVGVAIESVALAAGLDFVPLAEERFDLVIPADRAEGPPVSRLLDALDDRAFRIEVEHLPGYDGAISGHVTTLDAA